MLPGEAGINVRKTARYAGKDCDPLRDARLTEKVAPKTVNEEVGFLLRLLGDMGDLLRVRLRKKKLLKLVSVRRTPLPKRSGRVA